MIEFVGEYVQVNDRLSKVETTVIDLQERQNQTEVRLNEIDNRVDANTNNNLDLNKEIKALIKANKLKFWSGIKLWITIIIVISILVIILFKI